MRRYLLLPILIVFALSGCSNYSQQFEENALVVLRDSGLTGTIEFQYDKSLEGNEFYNMSVTSEGFEDKSIEEKKQILNHLDNISVYKSKMLISNVEVFSQENLYSLKYGHLRKNDERFPPVSMKPPFVMPTGDFSLSWNTYNSEYNSLGGILTIQRRGTNYSMKLVMPDGSSAVYALYVISDVGEIRLTERPGNAYGDYMYISSTGYLYFCDDQGVIYTAPPVD